MTNDKSLKMTKNPPVGRMQKKQSSTECPSISKKASVGKSKRVLKYGKDYHIRMNSAVLLSDPSFINDFLLSISSFEDLEAFKYFPEHLLDDYKLVDKPQSGYSKRLGTYILQLINYVKYLAQNRIPNDIVIPPPDPPPDPPYVFDTNDSFELSFTIGSLIDKANLSQEDPSDFIDELFLDINPNGLTGFSTIIDLLIDMGYLPDEDACIFMEKLYLGVNPSKKPRDLIKWMGPRVALISWLIGCYLTNALLVGKNKRKKHRVKNPDIGKYEKKEMMAARPCFKTFIENHFDLVNDRSNPSTLHREIEAIFDFLLVLRELDIGEKGNMSQKEVLMDLLTSKDRKSLGLNMRDDKYKDVISGCSCIPEFPIHKKLLQA